MILDSYLLLSIEEILSWLKGTQYYSHLDLRERYFHIPFANKDVPKLFFLVGMVCLSTSLYHLGLRMPQVYFRG